MLYEYVRAICPHIPYIHEEVSSSVMTDKSIEWCRWDDLDDSLKVNFTNILSGDDKTILDGIVATCPEYSDEVSETCLCLRISDFIESLDGVNNNIDVDKLINVENSKIGKKVTGNADNQDCDFDALLLLPSNLTGFATNAIELDIRASDITGNNNMTMRVYGTNNVEVGSGFDMTPTSANTWQTKVITASQLLAGTFTAGQMFRIRIHIIVDNADMIDISDGKVKFS